MLAWLILCLSWKSARHPFVMVRIARSNTKGWFILLLEVQGCQWLSVYEIHFIVFSFQKSTMSLAKPAMRGLLAKRLRFHLPIAFALSLIAAAGFKVSCIVFCMIICNIIGPLWPSFLFIYVYVEMLLKMIIFKAPFVMM